MITDALRGLSLAYRQVLVLRHAVGLPVDEVARQLGVPVGTVQPLAQGPQRGESPSTLACDLTRWAYRMAR